MQNEIPQNEHCSILTDDVIEDFVILGIIYILGLKATSQ